MLSTFNLKRLVYAKSTHVRKFWLSGVGGSYSTSAAAYLSGVTMHPTGDRAFEGINREGTLKHGPNIGKLGQKRGLRISMKTSGEMVAFVIESWSFLLSIITCYKET